MLYRTDVIQGPERLPTISGITYVHAAVTVAIMCVIIMVCRCVFNLFITLYLEAKLLHIYSTIQSPAWGLWLSLTILSGIALTGKVSESNKNYF